MQAKVILGFTASVGLEEMTVELIHTKFMDKLQLVTQQEKEINKTQRALDAIAMTIMTP